MIPAKRKKKNQDSVISSESEEDVDFINSDETSNESSIQNLKDTYILCDYVIVKCKGEFLMIQVLLQN